MPTKRSYVGPREQVADALTARPPLVPQPYMGPQYTGPSVAVRPDLVRNSLRGETVSGAVPIGQSEVHGHVSMDPRLRVQDAGIGGSAPVGPGRAGIDVDTFKQLMASYSVPIGKASANISGSISPRDAGIRAGVRVPFKL